MVRPARADLCPHFDVFEGRSFRCPVLVIQRVGCCLSEEIFLHREFFDCAHCLTRRLDQADIKLVSGIPTWNASSRYGSVTPSHGTIAHKCGGLRAATRYCDIANRKHPPADSPGTPRLTCRPFDQVVVIFVILLPGDSGASFGFVHTSNIRLKDGVALPEPVHRIRCFKSLLAVSN